MFEIKITLDKKTLEVLEKIAERFALPDPVREAPVTPAPVVQTAPAVAQTVVTTPSAAPSATPSAAPAPEPTPAVAPASVAEQVQPVATQAPTYTAQDLAIAATQLMDAGRQADVVALLGKYGVQALTMLTPEQYGAFATDLRTMGARI